MKRVTAAIYERYLDAHCLNHLFEKNHIDTKLVKKFAVQVIPEHVEKAKEVLKQEEGRIALENARPKAEVEFE